MADPLQRLARELAAIAAARGTAIPVDDTFRLIVPAAIAHPYRSFEWYIKHHFNTHAERELGEVGLSISGGSMPGPLEIRKNR